MRRIWYVIIFVLLVGAVVASPGIIGFWLEQNYQKNVLAFNSDSAKVQVTEYRRGWLDSDAKITIAIPDSDKPNSTSPVITIDQHFTHGPLVYDPAQAKWILALGLIQSNVHVINENKILSKEAQPNGIVQASTVADFNQNYTTQLQTPVFTMTDPTFQLNWQGFKGTETLSLKDSVMTNLQVNLESAPLSIKDNNNRIFNIQGITIQGERSCQQENMCSSSGSWLITGINASNNKTTAKIESIKLSSAYTVQSNQSYNTNLQLGLNKADFMKYSISSADVKLAYNNINVPDVKYSPLDFYNNELPKLIKTDTTMASDVAVKTSVGDVTANIQAFWPKGVPLPKKMNELTKNVNVNGALKASVSLVNQIVHELDGTADAANKPASQAQAAPTPAMAKEDVAKNFENGITSLVEQKKLTDDVGKALRALYKQHVPTAIYSESIDKFVAANQVSAELAPQLKDQYSKAEAATDAAASGSTTPVGQTDMEKQIASFVEQKKITAEVGLSLADLAKQKLSPSIFGTAIDNFVGNGTIPEPEAKILKDLYSKGGASVSPANQVVAAENAATAQAPAGSAKAQLDSMIKQGFLKQEGDDYVMTINYTGGVLKVNDVVVPQAQ